ncbi:I78 family peptidase inhibitor [Chromohalobacter nigrandesensis]|uniref:I78 family peptidase inhibitor n=1 Tax=Chromohalobacter nigrandesensis TaxID=119863 RepID=UPI001FF1E873|nr:I78 family peptidase inhibitor [Chromohalobacter nigrandesensis]MCK0745492.1 hypothetical protein [Chromohalobacter nigrandesensis]
MSKYALSGVMAVFLLAGCAGSSTPDEAPPPPSMSQDDACGAKALNDYVGQRADGETVGQLETDSAVERVRVIRPGQAVTMDYRADRLNVKLDDEDTIVELTCG